MESQANSKTLFPYTNITDCSQGLCSLYCPQWCYIIFPPPPPFEFPDNDSSTNFSPLVIAIIAVLASAFLLVSYYTFISKYCFHNDSARRGETHDHQHEELEDNHNPSLHDPWHVATTGLDEALIGSITVFKYKKADGLIEGTDCSVCLGEFQEDDSIRLLPKCSHAFHVPCIDTWLRSHSNCPLCRANIVFYGASQPQLPPPPVTESPQGNESPPDTEQASENVAVTQDLERVASAEEEIVQNDGNPKTPFRAFSDLGNIVERDTMIEIRDDGHEHVRRSVSMDHSSQRRSSVADILDMNQQDEVIQVGDCSAEVGSSSKHSAYVNKSHHRPRRVLNCIPSPDTFKRPFSRGKVLLTRQRTVHETSSPV